MVHADGHGPLVSGYTMTSWTLADGLPLGPVHAITQDVDGFLWLGTASGVMRFDGARFIPWDSTLAAPPPRTDVFALGWGRGGALWIGFGRLGNDVTVRVLHKGVLSAVPHGDAPRQATTSVRPDRAGRVWAVSGGALYRLQRGRWDVIRQGEIRRAEVISIREDETGTLWVGTRQGLFRSPDGEAFDRVDERISRETSRGLDGSLWVTDPVHGARRQGARQPLGLDGLGAHLLNDSQGNLWVATSGQGLWRVRDEGTTPPLVEHASVQTGLSSDVVQSLFEDREGNVWVGTMLGLHSLTPQELTPVAPGALVRALLPEADGSMSVGTANGLLRYRREGGSWRRGPVDVRIGLRTLVRDSRSRTWVGTDAGLRALERGRLVDSSATPGDPLCTAGVTLTVAGGPLPRCVSRDALWSGSSDGTLTVQRGHAVETVAAAAASGDSGRPSIDAIFEDRHGVIWAGGTSGLWRVQGGSVQHVGERDGLLVQRVMGITESLDGFLWLAVDRGVRYPGRRAAVVRLDPAAIGREARSRQPMSGSRVYDVGNGLAGIPLPPVSAARSNDGTLWFAFGGGLTVVDPARIAHERRRAAAAPRLVGARVDDRPTALAAAAVLPAGTRRVQIDYTALRLTAPGQIRFRYRLDGFDSAWVEVGPRRQALYTNLAPGAYVFRVQANGDGVTWSEAATWPIELRPAFYQAAWFYALGGLALLLVAWGAAHTRVWILNRQFAATLAERTRLSREIHDTMLQSLVGIALQVQAIARACAPGTGERAQLVTLRQQVEEYIREARQAIQNLRSPMLDARGLAGALTEVGRRLVTAPTRFDVDSDQAVTASAASEGELLRIAQEAIANAARHAGAAHIRVDLRQERHAVRLRVTDDGRGFDVAATLGAETGHYGLKGMQERARRIGARLTVSSSAAGTVVEAIVPCTRRYA